MATEIEYIIETDGGEYAVEIDDAETEDQWDHETTMLLLNMFITDIEKFKDTKIRKKNLWTKIAVQIGKSPESCDRKFRNLKQTYIRLVIKKLTNGNTKSKWPYFQIFENIFCHDGVYEKEISKHFKGLDNAQDSSYINTSSFDHELLADGNINGQSAENRHKISRKRFTEFKTATLEMRDRQKVVEAKLDRLINMVEESNSIQRERNLLFQEYLNRLAAQNQ